MRRDDLPRVFRRPRSTWLTGASAGPDKAVFSLLTGLLVMNAAGFEPATSWVLVYLETPKLPDFPATRTALGPSQNTEVEPWVGQRSFGPLRLQHF
jgi:hypothetical protein